MATSGTLPSSPQISRIPPELAISPEAGSEDLFPESHESTTSGTSTPTSPTPLTPTTAQQLAIKPDTHSPQPEEDMGMAATATVVTLNAPKTSVTSKEWVVPPRPKPGRKPATDTPPTKRKAQNRAAQRAFRERRAARVGELEAQLDEQREQHEHVEQELRDRSRGLEMEVANLRTRCAMLEDLLEKERLQRHRVSSELEAMQRWRDDRTSDSSRSGSLPLPGSQLPLLTARLLPRAGLCNHLDHQHPAPNLPISRILSPLEPRSTSRSPHQASAQIGCGSCEPTTGPCACVDEVLAKAAHAVECEKCRSGSKCLEATALDSSKTDSDLKRKLSSLSPHAPEEKRLKSTHTEHEIDFTAVFSKKGPQTPGEHTASVFQPLPAATVPPRDSCGFCKEGTYCVCADSESRAQTLAPISAQVQTPPASDSDEANPMDSAGSVKLPSLQSLTTESNVRGAAGPGTCAQCLSDPKSGLFCRSLAASIEKRGKSVDGCCGGTAGTPCAKHSTSSASSPGPQGRLSVSCADAYKTLSSHKNFEKAADDINSWLPQLRAVPKPREVGERADGRHMPIEVEAASIMSVLKGFDIRFGKDR